MEELTGGVEEEEELTGGWRSSPEGWRSSVEGGGAQWRVEELTGGSLSSAASELLRHSSMLAAHETCRPAVCPPPAARRPLPIRRRPSVRLPPSVRPSVRPSTARSNSS